MTNPSSERRSGKKHNAHGVLTGALKPAGGIYPRPAEAGIGGQVEPYPWPVEEKQWLREGIVLPSSAELGVCDRICPEHRRHCDAYGDGRLHNINHEGEHACANCDDWEPRDGAQCPRGRCPWGVCP